MKFNLDLPRSQNQQDFLDYFNAEIRKRMKSYQGSFFMEDDTFITTISGLFSMDQLSLPLEWKVSQDSKGTITEISVEATDSQAPESNWDEFVYQFFHSVTMATLRDKKQTYFRRQMYHYLGPSLDGEYWLPGYRFAPMIPDDEFISAQNFERITVIDQTIEATDGIKATLIANVTAARISARLSLLIDVALTKPEGVHRWVTRFSDNNKETFRLPMGYYDGNYPDIMPKKKELYKLGEYKGNLTAHRAHHGPLYLPKKIRKILKAIDQAEPLVTNCFDQGARLYQVALVCGRFFPSVELAYRVAAVEAISKADPNCNGFSQFMRKHVKSRTSIDPILEYLHGKARSAHFHSGEFPLGEYTKTHSFDPFKEFDAIEAESYHLIGLKITREAIINWILELVPDEMKSESA